MRDQKEFMNKMLDLVQLAKNQDSYIAKAQVQEFCKDLNLSSSQMNLVYDFLREHHIEVEGSASQIDESLNTEDSRYLRIYRRELRALPEVSEEEKESLYDRLLDGDESVQNKVVETYLKRVVTLAGKYKNRGVPLEDLIQEGNLVLLMTVADLCGNSDIEDVKKELDRKVRSRMIELADSQLENRGQENTILAKTNLIHEATKVLAEDWGRLATVAELAEYTRMTEEEICMYIDLSLEEIKVAKE